MRYSVDDWWQRWAAALIAIISQACTTTTTTQIIPGPERESRARVDSAPIVNSTWRWDCREFTGKIFWEDCEVEKSWEERELRITKTKPNHTIAYLVMLAGAGLSVAGTALYDYSPEAHLKCPEPPKSGNVVGGSGGCSIEQESNELPLGLMVAGAVVFLAGAGARWGLKPSTKMEDGKRELKTQRARASCGQPRDLAELKLVLQIAPRKFLPIQVDEDWSARIVVPEGVTVPRNSELPVLLYKVPRGLSTLLGRWQRIGEARIDE